MTENLALPTQQRERIDNIDIIRGFALLGILLMNIQSFSMIFAAYSNPTVYGDLTGINYYIYYFSHIFADQKFMTIFSILFGVGIVLMNNNVLAKGGRAGRMHYKRMFFLAVFGLMHAYLLWYGDILLPYAISGMLAFTLRNKSPRFLFIFAFILIALSSLIMFLAGWSLPHWEEADLLMMKELWSPSQMTIANDTANNLLSWLGQTEQRTVMASKMQSNLPFYLTRVLGLMLIGMALFKLDFFGKAFSNRFYKVAAIISLALGFPLAIYGNYQNFAHNWSLEFSMFFGIQFNYWASIIIAFGYICLLILFCRADILTSFKQRIANVGRMALSNYLSHTFICGFIFYGWGLGNYGSVERIGQFAVVVSVWIFQLYFSSFWLKHYQFGPFEWLWRSLTYSKLQPLKR